MLYSVPFINPLVDVWCKKVQPYVGLSGYINICDTDDMTIERFKVDDIKSLINDLKNAYISGGSVYSTFNLTSKSYLDGVFRIRESRKSGTTIVELFYRGKRVINIRHTKRFLYVNGERVCKFNNGMVDVHLIQFSIIDDKYCFVLEQSHEDCICLGFDTEYNLDLLCGLKNVESISNKYLKIANKSKLIFG